MADTAPLQIIQTALARGASVPSKDAAGQSDAAMRHEAGRNSFDRLVLQSLPAALRFATRLTGDPLLAEEVVQEALLRATRSWQAFRAESEFGTWLLRIVVNAFRDQLRRRHSSEDLSDSLPDDRSADPVILAQHAEQGRMVADAVSSLPPRQREVLVLVVYEQLSTEEAARVLNTSETNVRANLSYARAALKKMLAAYRDEP